MTSAQAPVTISAVIPAYNRGALIGRAIESVLAQSRPPEEIIVVDDGSTDDTAERVRAFGDRVRYVFQPNGGGAAARNRGVEEARGEWIAFLDSDDTWLPEHLRLMEAAIVQTHGRAGFYFGDTQRTAAEGHRRLWDIAGLSVRAPNERRDDASQWVMMKVQPMMLQSAVFDRDAYRAAGALETRLVRRHDTHLFLRLGLGRSACAVRGTGARMTSDDESGVRLITAHDSRSRVYWECSVLLYDDVLRRTPSLSAAHRRELRRRLGNARWRLARRALAERHPVALARHVALSFAASPAEVGRALASAGGAYLRSLLALPAARRR